MELITGASSGDRRSLARLLSEVERGEAIPPGAFGVNLELPYTVGLTGAPGAGKSSLTDALVGAYRGRGERCAVLAIDPSSATSHGAILGDRVRLRQSHSADFDVYFRSLANRGRLGGLADAVPDAARAFGAAGWPNLFVETVGVGQAEIEIAAWADTTVLVVTPRWGDEVQVSKAGVLEVADILVVNKADQSGAGRTVRDLKQMIRSNRDGWTPPVLLTTATKDEGIDGLLDAVYAHRESLDRSGELERRQLGRKAGESRKALIEFVSARIESVATSKPGTEIVGLYEAGEIGIGEAAERLLSLVGGNER